MREPIKPIIFLDFDGVLNSMQLTRRYPGGWNMLDRDAVKRVNQLVERTGAIVVVSSSWRLLERGGMGPVVRLTKILRDNGATFDVYAVTPYITNCPHRDPGPCPWDEICRRGMEIQQWLNENGAKDHPIVILDDSGDMAHLMPYLVQTDGEYGLEDRHVERAIEVIESFPEE